MQWVGAAGEWPEHTLRSRWTQARGHPALRFVSSAEWSKSFERGARRAQGAGCFLVTVSGSILAGKLGRPCCAYRYHYKEADCGGILGAQCEGHRHWEEPGRALPFHAERIVRPAVLFSIIIPAEPLKGAPGIMQGYLWAPSVRSTGSGGLAVLRQAESQPLPCLEYLTLPCPALRPLPCQPLQPSLGCSAGACTPFRGSSTSRGCASRPGRLSRCCRCWTAAGGKGRKAERGAGSLPPTSRSWRSPAWLTVREWRIQHMARFLRAGNHICHTRAEDTTSTLLPMRRRGSGQSARPAALRALWHRRRPSPQSMGISHQGRQCIKLSQAMSVYEKQAATLRVPAPRHRRKNRPRRRHSR